MRGLSPAKAIPGRPFASQQEVEQRIGASPYLNRELSWLAFNERVLNEAEASWPLLESLRFLATFFFILDELFVIRLFAFTVRWPPGTSKKVLTACSRATD
jgi:polyphosphate kinase